MEKELLEDFLDWAKTCGEDAWYIFENSDAAIERFMAQRREFVPVLEPERERAILDWFNAIKDDTIRRQAIENFDREESDLLVKSLGAALALGFYWSDSPQDDEYWDELYDNPPALREVPDGKWKRRDGKWVNLNEEK